MQHDLINFFFFFVWGLIENKMPKFAMLHMHEYNNLPILISWATDWGDLQTEI